MSELIDKLNAEFKLKGFSPLTSKNYSFFIEKFIKKINKPFEDFNAEDINIFLSTLSTKSSSTIKLAAASLKFFFTEILHKEVHNIMLPKKEHETPTTLTKEEVKKLLDSTETQKSKLIMSLLYSSGLRISELINLKKEDLNLQEKIGWVRTGKKERIFTTSEILCNEIKNYLEKHPENIHLFSKAKPLTPRNIQKIIQKTALKAGIQKKVTSNTLRHSFITSLLESGTDSKIVQELLKPSSLSQEQLKSIKNPLEAIYTISAS